MGWQDDPIIPEQVHPAVAPGGTPSPLAQAVTGQATSVPTGDWRTQRQESTLPGGRKSVITSPSDLAMFVDGAPHAFGVAGRNAMEAIAAIPSMLMEGAAAASDRHHAPKPEQNIAGLISGQKPEPEPEEGFNVGTILANGVGLPKPEGDTENMISAVQKGATGAVLPLGAGKLLAEAGAVPKLANALMSQPVTQVVAGATGGAGGEIARQEGAGAGGQFTSGLAASLLPVLARNPGALLRLFQGPVQAMAKGGGAGMRERVADFAQAGDTPTLGQATASPVLRWLEGLSSIAPGSNLVMRGKATSQTANIGNKLEAEAGKLAPDSTKMDVGERIGQGVHEKMSQDSAEQQRLFSEFFDKLPDGKNTQIPFTNLKSALDELTKIDPNAPATSARQIHPVIAGIKSDIEKDIAGTPAKMSTPRDAREVAVELSPAIPEKTGLTYETIRRVKTALQNPLNFTAEKNAPAASDIKRLTDAMSSDLKGAADLHGPDARAALDSANNFTSNMHGEYAKMSGVIKQIQSNGLIKDEAQLYNSATAGTREGNRTIETVMKSLKPDDQKLLSSYFVRNLGKSTPGTSISAEAAADAGDTFSARTFLTNWNKLSPQAKSSFTNAARFGPEWQKHMDAVSKVASNIREGSSIFANPSGTAGAAANLGAGGFIIGSLLGNKLTQAATAGGTVALSAAAAKVLTSKRAVEFLSRAANKPTSALPVLVNQIGVAASRTGDEGLKALHDHLQEQLANDPIVK